ncbi:hypothetical protein EVAR_30072_1 [Eumeta japonica]|uniref:Uncharacterized protein n=1 Tax=Eumeta variegata TaxID=151549 RepID=A0A4C1X9G9_EUMVA|nr:hypothetical protein EVAR_30072_1 [Eumeta japonica]
MSYHYLRMLIQIDFPFNIRTGFASCDCLIKKKCTLFSQVELVDMHYGADGGDDCSPALLRHRQRALRDCHRTSKAGYFLATVPGSTPQRPARTWPFAQIAINIKVRDGGVASCPASSRRGYDPDGSVAMVRTIVSGIMPVPSPHRPRAHAVRERAVVAHVQSAGGGGTPAKGGTGYALARSFARGASTPSMHWRH